MYQFIVSKCVCAAPWLNWTRPLKLFVLSKSLDSNRNWSRSWNVLCFWHFARSCVLMLCLCFEFYLHSMSIKTHSFCLTVCVSQCYLFVCTVFIISEINVIELSLWLRKCLLKSLGGTNPFSTSDNGLRWCLLSAIMRECVWVYVCVWWKDKNK